MSTPVVLLILNAVMAALAFTAYKRKHLTAGGAVSAHICGVIVTYALHYQGLLLFLLFYVTCNAAGKVCRKKAGNDRFEKKGSCRDSMQVLANGLMAVTAALMYLTSSSFTSVIMFGAALAESTSDTLAGEIGRLSSVPPLSMRTFRRVEKGMSGGVTPLGFLGGFLGSALISVFWALLFPVSGGVKYAVLICFCGFFGCTADSLLGASAQALYYDREKNSYTEKEVTDSGEPNELVRGVRYLDNDMVNLSSNILASLLAFSLSKIII